MALGPRSLTPCACSPSTRLMLSRLTGTSPPLFQSNTGRNTRRARRTSGFWNGLGNTSATMQVTLASCCSTTNSANLGEAQPGRGCLDETRLDITSAGELSPAHMVQFREIQKNVSL